MKAAAQRPAQREADDIGNGLSSIFKRQRWKVIICTVTSACMFFGSLYLAMYAFFIYQGADAIQGKAFSSFAVLALPLWVAMPVYLGDIHVDAEGIGQWVWGKRVRYKRWSEIKTLEINEIIIRNYGFRYVTSYWLLTKEKQGWFSSQVHGVGFDSELPNVAKLVDVVKSNLQKYGSSSCRQARSCSWQMTSH